jgi:chemotaxis receptor (MCP) glutamine deamidase CheD
MENVIEIRTPGEMLHGGSDHTIRISNITAGVGIVLLDPLHRLGAGAYIILPNLAKRQISDMLTLLRQNGSQGNGIWAKIAGGAGFMSVDMGKRISESVMDACAQLNIPIKGKDIGGKEKRELTVVLRTGDVRVSSIDGEKRI